MDTTCTLRKAYYGFTFNDNKPRQDSQSDAGGNARGT